MILSLLVLSITLNSGFPTKEEIEQAQKKEDYGKITPHPLQVEFPPIPPPQPDGLPHPESRPKGTFLPHPLDEDIYSRMLFLDIYPSLCQNTIIANLDFVGEVAAKEIAMLNQIHELNMLSLEVENDNLKAELKGKWPSALVIVTVVIDGIAGAGIGYKIATRGK